MNAVVDTLALITPTEAVPFNKVSPELIQTPTLAPSPTSPTSVQSPTRQPSEPMHELPVSADAPDPIVTVAGTNGVVIVDAPREEESAAVLKGIQMPTSAPKPKSPILVQSPTRQPLD